MCTLYSEYSALCTVQLSSAQQRYIQALHMLPTAHPAMQSATGIPPCACVSFVSHVKFTIDSPNAYTHCCHTRTHTHMLCLLRAHGVLCRRNVLTVRVDDIFLCEKRIVFPLSMIFKFKKKNFDIIFRSCNSWYIWIHIHFHLAKIVSSCLPNSRKKRVRFHKTNVSFFHSTLWIECYMQKVR